MSLSFKRAELCCIISAEACLFQIKILCVEERTAKLQKRLHGKSCVHFFSDNGRDEESGPRGGEEDVHAY